jgi:hypothetical protein
VTTKTPRSVPLTKRNGMRGFSPGHRAALCGELERQQDSGGNVWVKGFEGLSGNESSLHHSQSPCRVSDLGSLTV